MTTYVYLLQASCTTISILVHVRACMHRAICTCNNMPSSCIHPPYSWKQWLPPFEYYHGQQYDNHSQKENNQSSDEYPPYLTSSGRRAQSGSLFTGCWFSCSTFLWLLTRWLSFWRTNGCGDWGSSYKWAVRRSKGV